MKIGKFHLLTQSQIDYLVYLKFQPQLLDVLKQCTLKSEYSKSKLFKSVFFSGNIDLSSRKSSNNVSPKHEPVVQVDDFQLAEKFKLENSLLKDEIQKIKLEKEQIAQDYESQLNSMDAKNSRLHNEIEKNPR